MRSGTSCFDRTVFKKTVLRFWPLWAFYFAVWLIVLPLNGLMTLRWSGFTSSDSFEYFSYSTVPGLTGTCLFMAVTFGVLAAMAVLSHLYNARSANFFGTLPIRREGLFLTHYLAGLAFLVVPNVVIALLTLLVELAGSHVCLPGLLFWLAVSCGECFFFYSMAVFCGMFTGHILALPAFYGIFNALAVAITGLLAATLEIFYYGYAGPGDWMETIARWLTPVWALRNAVRSWFGYNSAGHHVLELNGLSTVGVFALAGLALAVGSFFLYRARRLESAGDVVSVRCMRPVFKYGVALMAGLCLGFLTSLFLSGGETGLMISIVVWGVIGYFAAQMLLDKSFKVFRKWKGAAAAAAAFVLLFLVVGFDLTGFETRIPNEADVASVEVNGLSWGWYGDSGYYVDLELDDPQSIRLMMDLHRAAIGQRNNTGRWLAVGPRDDTVPTVAGRSTYFTLTYRLANGSTLSRQYTLYIDPSQVNQEGTSAWALERIFSDRDLYWRVYGFDLVESYLATGARLDHASYYYARYEDMDENWKDPTLYYYGADAQALLDAAEEDFRAGRTGTRSVTNSDGYERNDYERRVSFEIRRGDARVYTLCVFVPDTAASTLAALDQLSGTP